MTQERFGEYTYQVWAADGSGEFMFSELLKPGAYAKKPFGDVLANLRVPKVSLFYGESDWMCVRSAEKMLEQIDDMRRAPKSVEEFLVGNSSAAGVGVASSAAGSASSANGSSAASNNSVPSTSNSSVRGVSRRIQEHEKRAADTSLFAQQPAPLQVSNSTYEVADAELPRVPRSGHQMYLESPREFVEVVCRCLRSPNLVLRGDVLASEASSPGTASAPATAAAGAAGAAL